MQRYTCQAIRHLDSESRRAAAVICFGREETQRRLQKGVKRLFGGKIGLIARDGAPEKDWDIDRVVVRRASHQRQLRPDFIADLF